MSVQSGEQKKSHGTSVLSKSEELKNAQNWKQTPPRIYVNILAASVPGAKSPMKSSSHHTKDMEIDLGVWRRHKPALQGRKSSAQKSNQYRHHRRVPPSPRCGIFLPAPHSLASLAAGHHHAGQRTKGVNQRIRLWPPIR